MVGLYRRALLGLTLLCAGSSVLRADPPLFLVDAELEPNPSRIYSVTPGGQMTLKATLDPTYTPCFALAAASATQLYASCTDAVDDADGTCVNCLLLRIVLDPLSSTPISVTNIGRIKQGNDTIDTFVGLGFRANGDLYGVTEALSSPPSASGFGDSLFRVSTSNASATFIGKVTVGCTSTLVDLNGGDITFDSLDRLWLWTNGNGTSQKGLWEVNPANACASQFTSCVSTPNLSGLAVIGHLSANTHMRGSSPPQERLYSVVPNECPTGSVGLTLGGSTFNHLRGDIDSPFCESDATCADSNACTNDVCSPGGCLHNPISCDDGAACTTDTCDPATGCVFTSACDDGNACTTDSCDQAGGCVHTPIVCDDESACTTDTCNPASGCAYTPIACDDGDACTTDTCHPVNGCVSTPVVCNDDDDCTADTCNPEEGCVYTPIVCGDGDACTTDSCNPAGGCVYTPIACGDGDACTTDTCDPASGCVYTPIVCGDGDACTTDTCDPASGCVYTPIVCGDGDACTTDTCDPASGCVYTPIVCGDGDACTTDTCDPASGCVYTPIVCGDGDACTTDTCDPASGCVYTPIVCGDGDACTTDTCDPASGCVYTPIVCGDGDACTTDTCDPASGCVYTPIVCGDGDACTTDTCDPASGCVYTPIVCGDGDACTTDTCDPASGCVYTPIVCGDGDACTTDTCDPASGCVYTPIVCDDQNACTTDTCNTVTGCVFVSNSGPGEVTGVGFSADDTLTWVPVTGTTYDVVRGALAQLPVGGGPAETCLAQDHPLSTLTEPTVPDLGAGLWYLVRAQNPCGTGTYGRRTNATERVTAACP